jgi:hypothetical protein
VVRLGQSLPQGVQLGKVLVEGLDHLITRLQERHRSRIELGPDGGMSGFRAGRRVSG